VTERLLVWPVNIVHHGQPQRFRDRTVSALFRLTAAASNIIFDGRGTAFASRIAAPSPCSISCLSGCQPMLATGCSF
jgi:hypothetical protein